MKNLHHFGFFGFVRGELCPEETDPGREECCLLDRELERDDLDRADAEAIAFRWLPEDRLFLLEDLLELCCELLRLRGVSDLLFRPEPRDD